MESINDNQHQHRWFDKSLTKPAACNHCSTVIWGFKDAASCCGDCRYISHKKCASSVDAPCRPEVVDGDTVDHHWIKGNVTHTVENAKCEFCKKGLISDGNLHDWRCTWCEKTVCNKCFDEKEGLLECDLGKLADLKVSPLYGIQERFAQIPNQPLLVFVNRNSGGKQGEVILRRIRQCLSGVQVFDMIADGGAAKGLQLFMGVPVRILVAGGDGTVNWVLTDMHRLGLSYPVAVLPLGTGNDTSRFLGWGGGYSGENIFPILQQITEAVTVPLDRWVLESFDVDGEQLAEPKYLNNYFSVGVDAKMLTGFHNKRESNQNLFTSRKVNKIWYGAYGLKAIFNGCKGLPNSVKVEVNGEEVVLNDNSQAIILVNGPSYAAGTDLWKSADTDQFFDDQQMELVTAKNIQNLAAVKTNTGFPFCVTQGREFRFTFESDEDIPVQIDGEPFVHGKGYIVIRHFEQANMLARNDPDILKHCLVFQDIV